MNSFSMDSQLVLTQRQLSAIGSVAVESTYCEQEVQRTIWMLAELVDDVGLMFTENLSMSHRLDLLARLGKNKLETPQAQLGFAELIMDMKAANEERNRVVHGDWAADSKYMRGLMKNGPDSYPPAIAAKTRRNGQVVKFSASDVAGTAKKIFRLRYRLIWFTMENWPDLLPPGEADIVEIFGDFDNWLSYADFGP